MVLDTDVLNYWVKIAVVIATLCTISVPVSYAFSTWYKSWLGQLFMFQSIAFSVAMVLMSIRTLWDIVPDVVVFIGIVFTLTLIAVSTLGLTTMIIKYNYPRSQGRHAHDHE